MKILVTGGAGYIGSIVAECLIRKGYEVLVLDNLQQGHREAVLKEAEFIRADIGDTDKLGQVFRQHDIYAVLHLAADSIVESSMKDPGRFFRNNVVGGLNLLTAMLKYNVHRIIFSSTAAVYGKPRGSPIRENQSKAPVNAYGESKLIFERILGWYEKAHGLKHISLRYFNAAGASEILGEDHRPETHLIPVLLKAALDKNDSVNIFGTDYPTKDGTCVRDYIHVADIASAHILALERIDGSNGHAYNLGNGEGYTVKEVVDAAKQVTGTDITTRISPRRLGDPVRLVASSQLAREELGWVPKFPGIENIIETAWKWFKAHPHGYNRNNNG